jgi:hypothetical protein
MKKCLYFAVLACLIAVSLPYTCFSQEEKIEDVEYGYGTVISVNKDTREITIQEDTWGAEEAGEGTKATYSIDPAVKVENVASWEEVPAGKHVDVEYITDANGKKIAKYIYLYTDEETETETPEVE